MNDRTFIEAGCQLALADAAGTVESVSSLFESVLSREPSPSELENLTKQFREALGYYEAHIDDAQALLGHVGEETPTEEASERAALAIVAMTILNLDEAITRQ